jgi:DMSO/TMAO reductase YedYZ molybdopterin-dependent catalytic subunit
MVRVRGRVNDPERPPSGGRGWGAFDDRLRRLAPSRVGPFREGAFRSRLHAERNAAWLGIALGVAFSVCFLTGLISHLIQHPPSWFGWPSRPLWLYRVTQGAHVAFGIAAIPLLLMKLWVVAPRLWTWPPFRSVPHLAERVSLFPLVAGALFLLFTGIGSINLFKPWGFSFPAAHYTAAWIAIGGLIIHVGAKLHVAARALARSSKAHVDVGRATQVPSDSFTRRGFLAGASVVAVSVATLGQTVRPLRRVSVLAPRDPAIGPQGVPVNRTARSAGVTDAATSPGYRLTVDGSVETPLSLSMDEVRALPQHSATLPITCVDGWSASGVWGGVRVRDLLRVARAAASSPVEIVSMQRPGTAYATSLLEADHAADPDTLLALELNGEPLVLDHGFPLRLVAPNRPGVMQTKWVTRVTVM